MAEEKEYVRVDVVVIRESEKAHLIENKGEEVWIPKSQIKDPGSYSPGDHCEMEIVDWIVKKNNLC